MGETRVELPHLLEDLRDAYPGATEETILVEVVANALDSAAATITITTTITTDPTAPALTVADDGSGMRRRELARYHDIASSTKIRGDRIGFAGVGIKIGLLVSDEVVTETKAGTHHVATSWRLASRHKPPWRRIPRPGMVGPRGTAVRLRLSSPLSPLLDLGFIESALRRQFQPLLDSALRDILAARYPHGDPGGRRASAGGVTRYAAGGRAGTAARRARSRETPKPSSSTSRTASRCSQPWWSGSPAGSAGSRSPGSVATLGPPGSPGPSLRRRWWSVRPARPLASRH